MKVLPLSALFFFWLALASSAFAQTTQPLLLRSALVPGIVDYGPVAEGQRRIVEAFRQHHPDILPVTTAGLNINSSAGSDILPLMQIAGDIAPDVLYVVFRNSHSYIQDKLLYPMDRYVQRVAGSKIADDSRLTNDEYLAAMAKAPHWDVLARRVPEQCWAVMRRTCPYGEKCPYRAEEGLPPLAEHRHVWAFPVAPLCIGLKYSKAMFAEHARDGIEMRAPRDWEELLKWAKILTDPENNEYGMKLNLELPGWYFTTFLYSAGGEVVQQDEHGNWRCTIATEEAAKTMWFFARMKLQQVQHDGQRFRGVAEASYGGRTASVRYAMELAYLDERFLDAGEAANFGFGPVPKGPSGLSRSEFNAKMCGIFAGLRNDPRRRDAAWDFIYFYDSDEARQIQTETMVDAGLGQFMRPFLLKQFNIDGRYDDILRQVSPELEETYRIAYANGVPEPYGKNCQYIYEELDKPLGEMWQSDEVRAAVDANDAQRGMRAIRPILARAQETINRKLLGILPREVERTREKTSWVVIVLVVGIFAMTFRRVLRAFAPREMVLITPSLAGNCHPERTREGSGIGRLGQILRGVPLRMTGRGASARRSGHKYRFAYVLLAPALLSIALWAYWPLARGTIIAFQNYSVLGDSSWVGSGNFAEVLYDAEFWHSIRVSITYALMFILFGFWTPIALALLLSEIPRGKVFFRTLYYLPAVLSGVIVVFLWRSFYGPRGIVNQVLNYPVDVINTLFHRHIEHFSSSWLDSPNAALFCCLLPIIWAGMGPGSLIYLAALKTVPEELYEAADIDGAGTLAKIFRVALPSIRSLILINLVGAVIGAVRGAAGFILAMTGGGPFTTSGGATEVTSLRIFYTTFGYLKFGPGAAMAWVLGAMLIGFTVLQLQRLSRLEFRTVAKP